MRGVVPDTILNNKVKVGFNASVFDLLDMKSERTADRLLEDSPIFDIVERTAIKK